MRQRRALLPVLRDTLPPLLTWLATLGTLRPTPP
jgi:hypothetical protein